MDIYAAVDVRSGKAVRLVRGDFAAETVYFDDPVEAARRWVADGADWLHVVDLDGARSGTRTNAEVTRRILAAVGDTPVQVGGGFRSLDAVRDALIDGAARVVLGTAAVRDPDFLTACALEFPARVALALDVNADNVMVEGWEQASESPVEVVVETAAAAGAAAIIYTDVSVEGTLTRPNIDRTRALVEFLGGRAPVIASGGVGAIDHVRDLRRTGADGVIIGTALYSGAITIADARAAAREDSYVN